MSNAPGFAIIFTRLSDGIGRQPAVIIAYVLFAAFSLGGGLAQTLGQLIALRFLQGIGGAGLYSMLMVIGVEITPVQYWGGLSGMIGLILATGSVLGICFWYCVFGSGWGLLCHYRTYPWWCHHRKGIVALDLLVQRSCRWSRNSSYAYLLAAKREIIQEAYYHLEIGSTSGLGGCHPIAGSLYIISLCPPRRWKYSIFMEQRNHHFHLDNLWGMLDRLFRLDILALFRQCNSTTGHLSFHHCAYQTSRPSHHVR